MADTKHTSGPWLVADRTHVYTAGLQLVAVVQHSRESEADARLIAAAPELLHHGAAAAGAVQGAAEIMREIGANKTADKLDELLRPFLLTIAKATGAAP